MVLNVNIQSCFQLLSISFLFACTQTTRQPTAPILTTPELEKVHKASITATPITPTPTLTKTPVSTRTLAPSFVQENTSEATVPPTSTPVLPPKHGLFPQVCSPLENFALEEILEIVSNPFIMPRPGRDDGHHGIDFAYYRRNGKPTLEGAAVRVIFAGKVASIIRDSIPYGNMIIVETPYEYLSSDVITSGDIDPSQSIYHLYAHMGNDLKVEMNDKLPCGQTIGFVGNSGWSGNPHLHLETRIGPMGISFESMAYYHTQTTEQERINYRRWRLGGEFRPMDPMILLQLGD